MNPTPILDYFVQLLTFCLSLFRSFRVFLHFLFSDKGRYQTNPWLLLCLCSLLLLVLLSVSDRSYRLSVCPSNNANFGLSFLNFPLFYSSSRILSLLYSIQLPLGQSSVRQLTNNLAYCDSLRRPPWPPPLFVYPSAGATTTSPSTLLQFPRPRSTTLQLLLPANKAQTKTTQKSSKMSEADQEWKPSGRPTSFVSPSPSPRSFRNKRN